jgi:murein DD-endopeptidase MepM/ murein hydrolase activator NlpD
MRGRAQIAALGVTAAVLLFAWAPMDASSSGCVTGASGGTTASSTCTGGRYVNPFKGQSWIAGRIDMGVDYTANRREPVVAIGRARIMGSDSHSGWPGGHYLWYKLLRGDHRGDFIYVAESLKRLKPAGTTVRRGQRIATALRGRTGTEWGWANRNGDPRAHACYSEGMVTHSGKEMARFLQELGSDVVGKLRSGPDEPSGRRC